MPPRALQSLFLPKRHLAIAKGAMHALPAEPDRAFSLQQGCLQARCC